MLSDSSNTFGGVLFCGKEFDELIKASIQIYTFP